MTPFVEQYVICYSNSKKNIASNEIKNEILYDSSKVQPSLNWATYNDPLKQDISNLTKEINQNSDLKFHQKKRISSLNMWKETSETVGDLTVRAYVICNMNGESFNWLRVPFVNVDRSQYVYINMTFSMRKCVNNSNCKESFSMYYQINQKDLQFNQPNHPFENFKLLHLISPKLHIKSDNPTNKLLNFKIFIKKTGFLSLAFLDKGACVAIRKLVIFRKVCPKTFLNYAMFPETSVANQTQHVYGQCVNNSIWGLKNYQFDKFKSFKLKKNKKTIHHNYLKLLPKAICTNHGWIQVNNNCQCLPGFEPKNNICSECGRNYYKSIKNQTVCKKCPKNSTSRLGSSFCTCISGYFRAKDESLESKCSNPPSAVQNLNVLFFDKLPNNSINSVYASHEIEDVNDMSKAMIKWDPPVDSGGRNDITYSVICSNCDSSIEFLPSIDMLKSTSVIIKNLKPNRLYSLKIVSQNGVSDVSNLVSYAKIDLKTTLEAINTIQNFEIELLKKGFIMLKWTKSNKYEKYEIRCQKFINFTYENVNTFQNASRNEKFENVLTTNNFANYTVEPYYYYAFEIRGLLNTKNKWWSKFSEPIVIYCDSKGYVKFQESIIHANYHIITISAVVFVILIIIGVILLKCFFKKRKNKKDCIQKYNVSMVMGESGSIIPVVSLDKGFNQQTGMITRENLSLKKENKSIYSSLENYYNFNELNCGIKTFEKSSVNFIYPDSYTSLKEALNSHFVELNHTDYSIISVIQSGIFGNLCKGKINKANGNCTLYEQLVAIKLLRKDYTDKEYFNEAVIMKQFNHPNIYSIVGVIFSVHPRMCVYEYMVNGLLSEFLMKFEHKLSDNVKMRFVINITEALLYFEKIGFLYKNLNTKNVYMNGYLQCKIGNFKESKNDGMMWICPETLLGDKFTYKSNVWKLGVLIWDIWSYGKLSTLNIPQKSYENDFIKPVNTETKPQIFLIRSKQTLLVTSLKPNQYFGELEPVYCLTNEKVEISEILKKCCNINSKDRMNLQSIQAILENTIFKNSHKFDIHKDNYYYKLSPILSNLKESSYMNNLDGILDVLSFLGLNFYITNFISQKIDNLSKFARLHNSIENVFQLLQIYDTDHQNTLSHLVSFISDFRKNYEINNDITKEYKNFQHPDTSFFDNTNSKTDTSSKCTNSTNSELFYNENIDFQFDNQISNQVKII
ncbi:hypothetical protein A3Q56_00274 [Intoshia linei]|uniref:Receptor protein-tyrosine kinase n=1 Tax=Intoshia linei TaxID=1819745 RepID=A0A177BE16_9BILA|nr:hypothetical protein A3Q56_00274 [Intoshia linei]